MLNILKKIKFNPRFQSILLWIRLYFQNNHIITCNVFYNYSKLRNGKKYSSASLPTNHNLMNYLNCISQKTYHVIFLIASYISFCYKMPAKYIYRLKKTSFNLLKKFVLQNCLIWFIIEYQMLNGGYHSSSNFNPRYFLRKKWLDE